MLSKRRFIGTMAACLLLSCFLFYGCGEKTSQEKMTENALEKATGKDVDVKMNGGKVQITGEDSQTEIAETATWPSDLTEDVPVFDAGNIKRVVKSKEKGDAWTFNIYVQNFTIDDVKKYEKALKGKGWQTDNTLVQNQGGYLNGQKGTMGVNFMFNLEKNDGMLAVYNRPE
jgi:hypothetical protein